MGGKRVNGPELPASKGRLPLFYLLLVFFLLTAGIVTAAFLYYRNYEKHYRVEVERQLSAIAELKVSELANWRAERLADAAIFYKNVAFTALVRRHFEQPEDQGAQNQLRTWLSQVQAAYRYDRVILLDPQYSKKMIIPDRPERSTSFVSPSSVDGLRSGKVVFEDFCRNEQNQRIYLKVLVPILDHFKRINDVHGHQAGDEALVAFTQCLQAQLRENDCVGRYGGEEFLVISAGSQGCMEEGLYERLCARVAETEIRTKSGPVSITVSIGVALGTGQSTADALLVAADEALYQAKTGGRDRVAYAIQDGRGSRVP